MNVIYLNVARTQCAGDCGRTVARPGMCSTCDAKRVALRAEMNRAARDAAEEEESLMQLADRCCAYAKCRHYIQPGERIVGEAATGKVWHPRCYVLENTPERESFWRRVLRAIWWSP